MGEPARETCQEEECRRDAQGDPVPLQPPRDALPPRFGPRLDRLAPYEPPQVLGQAFGCAGAARGLLLQALEDDRLEVHRDMRVDPAVRHGLAEEDLAQGVLRILPLEWRPCGPLREHGAPGSPLPFLSVEDSA